MSQFSLTSYRNQGFTLIEMMIVIAIIMTLLGLVLFPYSYYMQRAYVENSIDIIWQKWILAHKDIRNGKWFDESTSANKILIFQKWSHEVTQYLLSGSSIPSITEFDTSADIKSEHSILLESTIEILWFSGFGITDEDNWLGYSILAPSWEGQFFTGSLVPFSSTGVVLTVWYADAEIASGRAREILLRPYLQ